MYLVKTHTGQYIPFDSEDHEESQKIKAGTVVKATPPRNYEFLKKAMALFKLGHENDSRGLPFEVYRKWVILKAGYFHELPSNRGVEYIPESLAFDQMSEQRFSEVYDECLNVISNQLQLAPEEVQAELNSFY